MGGGLYNRPEISADAHRGSESKCDQNNVCVCVFEEQMEEEGLKCLRLQKYDQWQTEQCEMNIYQTAAGYLLKTFGCDLKL